MKFILALIFSIPTLCHAVTATDVLGRWVDVKYKQRLEINDNGKSFIVIEYRAMGLPKKFVATLTDGVLKINEGPFSMIIDIEKSSGHLIYSGKEYRRLKADESFEPPARTNPFNGK